MNDILYTAQCVPKNQIYGDHMTACVYYKKVQHISRLMHLYTPSCLECSLDPHSLSISLYYS